MKRITSPSDNFMQGDLNKKKAYAIYLRLSQLEDNIDEAKKVIKSYNISDRSSVSEFARGFFNGMDNIISIITEEEAHPIRESSEAPTLPRMAISGEEFSNLMTVCTVGMNMILDNSDQAWPCTPDGVRIKIDVDTMQKTIQNIINRFDVRIDESREMKMS